MISHSKTITLLAAVGLLTAALGVTTVAQSGDPSGTWTLNLAKSKYSPGPAPKSGTVTYSAAGAGTKVAVDLVGGDGTKLHWEYTANYDGKDYPVKGNPDADTASLKRINATTVEIQNKKGGKNTLLNTRVFGADGQTLTVTTKGTNAQGQATDNLQVFERK
jgi:hypothetical protein